MKNIDHYMSLNYKIEITKDDSENTYVVSFPELKGCITCGDTIDKALQLAEDAKREWFAACIEDGIEIPPPTSDNDFSGQFKLRIPKSLHRELAEHSKAEGISMNQYCLYLLSKADAAFHN